MQNVERLSITVPIDMARMIRAKVKEGGYASNSEVIREALRMLEQADARTRLQQAWREGIESGDFQPIDTAAVKAEGRKRLAAKQ